MSGAPTRTHTHLYAYIYIHRERERNIHASYIYIHFCIHTCIPMYSFSCLREHPKPSANSKKYPKFMTIIMGRCWWTLGMKLLWISRQSFALCGPTWCRLKTTPKRPHSRCLRSMAVLSTLSWYWRRILQIVLRWTRRRNMPSNVTNLTCSCFFGWRCGIQTPSAAWTSRHWHGSGEGVLSRLR